MGGRSGSSKISGGSGAPRSSGAPKSAEALEAEAMRRLNQQTVRDWIATQNPGHFIGANADQHLVIGGVTFNWFSEETPFVTKKGDRIMGNTYIANQQNYRGENVFLTLSVVEHTTPKKGKTYKWDTSTTGTRLW